MNVLNVSQNFSVYGGSDRYFFDLSSVLESHGHKVIPFTASGESDQESPWSTFFPSAADFNRPGLKDCYRYIYNTDARDKLNALLDEYPVDIVHLHIYYGKLTSSILSVFERRGIPVVQTLHEYKIVCPVYSKYRAGSSCSACKGGRFYNSLRYKCNRGSVARSALTMAESYVSKWLGNQTKVDRFIAISDFLRDSVVDMGMDPKRLVTLHNFVTHIEEEVGAKSDYIVYAGRFERIKGIWTLLDVASKLPHVTFKLAGHGGGEEELRNEVYKRGLHNIEFLGFLSQDKLKGVIRSARACVVPSEWDEPFGLAVVESMALGTPVVASRIGGIPEIITSGKDGLLCEPGSVEDFTSAVKKLIDSPDYALQLSTEAIKTVEVRFSRAAYYTKLIGLYEQLVMSKGVKAGEQ